MGRARTSIRPGRDGLTLLGLLVGLGLLTIVFLIAYEFLSYGARSSRSGMELAECNTISVLIMEGLVNELKTASRVIYPRQRGVASWTTLQDRDGRHKVLFLDKAEGVLKRRYLDEKEPTTLTRYGRGSPVFVKALRFHHLPGSEVVVKLGLARTQNPEKLVYQLVSSFSPRNLY